MALKSKNASFFKKYKLILIIFGVLAFFASLFIFGSNSGSKKIISEIKNASSNKAIVGIWDKFIDKTKNKAKKEKILKATREKLITMDLSNQEIASWHYRFRKANVDDKPALNIIIIPDLSRRIKQIPYTAPNDKEIITEIYNSFFNNARRYKSADKLILEVTDNGQARGIFAELARNLAIDMADKGNNTNNINYLKQKEVSFKENLDRLYTEAIKNPSGADYFYYFQRILPDRIKKSNIYHEYRNKIIILTDGYLETNDKGVVKTYTPTYGKLSPILQKAVKNGNLAEIMERNKLEIPSVHRKLPNTEVLVLEIKERQEGKGWHQEVLKNYWENWFKDMGVKNPSIRPHDDNINETTKFIRDFLGITS